MQITLYKNFKKKINSTKQPTGGTVVDVKLKNPTSRENPTFILNTTEQGYNYVKWGDHYYFVSNLVMVSNDHIEISCTQDILATYKSDILKTTAFVEYSTINYNVDLLDHRISNTGAVSRSSATNNSVVGFFDAGSYIVSTVGTSGTANRYIMTAANINTMMSYINTIDDDTILDAAAKKYGSVLDCILGCTWVPFTPDNDGNTYPVILGAYTVDNLSCKRCSSTMIAHSWTTTISIPWINSDAGRKARETMSLYLPGYGTIALETSKFIGLSSISLVMVADIIGGITYGIKNSGGTVEYFNTTVGAQVPITAYTQSPLGMVLGSSGIQKLTEAFFNAQPLTANSDNRSFVSNMSGILSNVNHSASSVGGQGGMTVGAMAQLNDVITLTNYSFQYSEAQADMATRYGRPLMAVTALSSLTGYCKCNGASVDIDGLEGDKNEVNSYLNSGFYIE